MDCRPSTMLNPSATAGRIRGLQTTPAPKDTAVTMLENFTYDEISLDQTAEYTRTVTERDITLFAAISGDVNPVHLDEDFAKTTRFGGRIAHGMITGALVSAALACVLPGPGCIYLNQSLRFTAPVRIGDTITVRLKVTAKRDDRRFVTLDCEAANQNGETVATGVAEVIAPKEKIQVKASDLPAITLG
jgi:3-hydroxybutyryl-CoA dehydratase